SVITMKMVLRAFCVNALSSDFSDAADRPHGRWQDHFHRRPNTADTPLRFLQKQPLFNTHDLLHSTSLLSCRYLLHSVCQSQITALGHTLTAACVFTQCCSQ